METGPVSLRNYGMNSGLLSSPCFSQWCLFLLLSPEFAMSPNNNEVHIYSKKGTKWEVEHVLKEV